MADRVEEQRARRRRLTLTVSGRRRRDHMRIVHGWGEAAVDCACELADTYFAKRSAVACDCRKRRRGNPRVASGMCHVGHRDRIYAWRREARFFMGAALAGRSPDGDEL